MGFSTEQRAWAAAAVEGKFSQLDLVSWRWRECCVMGESATRLLGVLYQKPESATSRTRAGGAGCQPENSSARAVSFSLRGSRVPHRRKKRSSYLGTCSPVPWGFLHHR